MKSKGFTFIEAVVSVAILAVCAFLVPLSLSTLFTSEARKCASELDALLSKTKIGAMSKENGVYLHLYLTANGEVAAEYFEKSGSVSLDILGGTRCSVSYTVDGTAVLLDGDGMYLSFRRDTGAMDFSRNSSWSEGAVCTAITVSGGGKAYVLTLVPATGAHALGG